MKTIPVSGVIGWDVSAKEIRAALEKAGGEDVEIQIASPGGLIYDGLEIFNLIRNYQGSKVTRLMGMAASMASYIAMAGDRVIAEDNAIFMIHNPWGISVGDQNDMQKMSAILEGFAALLAKAYSQKSGKPAEAVRALMDGETYYFGAESKDAGFVDEIVPAPKDAEKDKAAAMALAQAKLSACRKVIREVETAESLEQIAALLPSASKAAPVDVKPAGVAGVAAPSAAQTHSEEVLMTIEELKKEHPDLYAEVMKTGTEAGISQERARVAALERWLAADAGNAKVAAVVAEAKATGKSEADVMPQLQVAVREGTQKAEDPDNPPGVQTAAGVVLSDEDEKAMKLFNLSREDYLKYGDVHKEGGK